MGPKYYYTPTKQTLGSKEQSKPNRGALVICSRGRLQDAPLPCTTPATNDRPTTKRRPLRGGGSTTASSCCPRDAAKTWGGHRLSGHHGARAMGRVERTRRPYSMAVGQTFLSANAYFRKQAPTGSEDCVRFEVRPSLCCVFTTCGPKVKNSGVFRGASFRTPPHTIIATSLCRIFLEFLSLKQLQSEL